MKNIVYYTQFINQPPPPRMLDFATTGAYDFNFFL